MSQINGHISQIIGPVIDVFFDTKGQDAEKVLPKIHDALKIARPDGRELIVEVQQHIGEDTVRCVAMDNTDGLQRGLEVQQTGSPIVMPAGEQIKGRMMNVIGQPIDGMKPLSMDGAYPIHREAPKFEDLSTHKEMLATGIKVIDLLEPYMKGLSWNSSTTLPRDTMDILCSPVWENVPARATTLSAICSSLVLSAMERNSERQWKRENGTSLLLTRRS